MNVSWAPIIWQEQYLPCGTSSPQPLNCPILQMRKLRFREDKWLTRGHTVNTRRTWTLVHQLLKIVFYPLHHGLPYYWFYHTILYPSSNMYYNQIQWFLLVMFWFSLIKYKSYVPICQFIWRCLNKMSKTSWGKKEWAQTHKHTCKGTVARLGDSHGGSLVICFEGPGILSFVHFIAAFMTWNQLWAQEDGDLSPPSGKPWGRPGCFCFYGQKSLMLGKI